MITYWASLYNKYYCCFLQPPQTPLVHLSITHKPLSWERLFFLDPSEQYMEKPETTSGVKTGESILPSSVQINFLQSFCFSSDNISSDVVPGLIPASFDALKFSNEQYPTLICMYIFFFSASKEYFLMIFQCLFRSFLSQSSFLFGEESLCVSSDVTLTLYSDRKYAAMKSFLCVNIKIQRKYLNYLQDLPLGYPLPLKSVLALVFTSLRSINPTPRQFPKPPPNLLLPWFASPKDSKTHSAHFMLVQKFIVSTGI